MIQAIVTSILFAKLLDKEHPTIRSVAGSAIVVLGAVALVYGVQ